MGNQRQQRKRKLSWYQKEMRLVAIVVIVICLAVFAGIFYLANRWAGLPSN